MRKALVKLWRHGWALIRLAAIAPLVCAGVSDSAVAKPLTAEHVSVELISENLALAPGKTAWFGVRIKHEPHWHTYWINPGDSGLPTKLVWHLPAGYRAGEVAWPVPKRIAVGGLTNFGYEGNVLLPVPIEVPANAAPGTVVQVTLQASWLVCREECIPGKAELGLKVPVKAAPATANPRWAKLFAAARAGLPQAAAWNGEAVDLGKRIEVLLRGANLPPPTGLDLIPVQRKIVNYATPTIAQRDNALTLRMEKSDYFESSPHQVDWLLVSTQGTSVRAWTVSIPFAAATEVPPSPTSN